MRERAEALNGTLTMISKPGEGLKIKVLIPIK
jgi:signal transduction histidine kinase